MSPALNADVLHLDCAQEADRICSRMVEIVSKDLRRRGAVVALSGGVDSSVCAALAARAFGPDKVLALFLPERDSSAESERLGRRVAELLGVRSEVQDIGPALEAIGCYRWRDEAIRVLFPEYSGAWRNKIVIGGGLSGGLNFFRLVVQSPDGEIKQKRLPLREYLQIVAAQNYKQRLRKTVEYFHADRLHYAVIGTPNRLEYDQGFFVKNGDGAADLKPIAHLYKTQVYALARYLGVPEEICTARPTTDTYSLSQTQDEFYFGLPYERMDLALWAHEHRVPVAELARAMGLDEDGAARVYRDIEAKREATRYLHLAPLLVNPQQLG